MCQLCLFKTDKRFSLFDYTRDIARIANKLTRQFDPDVLSGDAPNSTARSPLLLETLKLMKSSNWAAA